MVNDNAEIKADEKQQYKTVPWITIRKQVAPKITRAASELTSARGESQSTRQRVLG